MPELSAATVLQRAPDVSARIDDQNVLRVAAAGGQLLAGPLSLSVLYAFHQPRTVGAACDLLRGGGVAEEELLRTIMLFLRAGVLRELSQARPRLAPFDQGYDAARIHVAMLNDRTRVSLFKQGIAAVVRPGDVVVDIGTGVGIFAMAAARAGARHVYAIEASAIAEHAERVIAASGLADRITVIRGWSTQVKLPERADVLTSEMVGSEPTGDYMLEMMLDARRRLLKPDARTVPGKVRIFGLALDLPAPVLARHAFDETATSAWSEQYGLDLSPLASAPYRAGAGYYIGVRTYEPQGWPTLCEPALLAEIDWAGVDELQIDRTIELQATAAGRIRGLLVYHEIELSPGVTMSIHPTHAARDSFRFSPIWVLDRPLEVRAGQLLLMRYRYRMPGARPGLSIELAEQEVV